MSVLWRGEDGGRVVEVRGAGRTRRLYVDGVFHTAWNPGMPLTGVVWDHLALATFFVAPGGARSVLVLGVGGGAVLQLLARHAPPDELVGIELDGGLLDIGRRWFDLEQTGAQLVCQDAAAWVAEHPRRRFDLVVDDLFIEAGGEPVRPPGLDGDWWLQLAPRVAPGGALVVNFVDHGDLTSSVLCQDVTLRSRFPAAFRFSCPGYENAAAAFLRRPLTAHAFRARLAQVPGLQSAAARRLMRFRVHTLWPR